ncbi:MAG: hypothetical protein QNK03_22105 [Myxococcota bacterium]|nr:hypothetical protein [Myxococcota bacterium]
MRTPSTLLPPATPLLLVLPPVLLLAAGAPLAASADSPRVLSFQGVLLDADGVELDGSVDFRITLCPTSVLPCDEEEEVEFRRPLYREVHLAVEVIGGLYELLVGSGTSREFAAALDAELFDRPSAPWLEVEIRRSGEPDFERLAPRQPLGSVPYALHAARAEELVGIETESILRMDQIGVVTTELLADGAVDTDKLASESVTGGTIANGTIGDVDLALQSVATSALRDGSVTSIKLAPNSVNGTHIVDGSVTSSEIADDAVDTFTILNGSVGASDLGADSVGASEIQERSVNRSHLGIGLSPFVPVAFGFVPDREPPRADTGNFKVSFVNDPDAPGGVYELELNDPTLCPETYDCIIIVTNGSRGPGHTAVQARDRISEDGHFLVFFRSTDGPFEGQVSIGDFYFVLYRAP